MMEKLAGVREWLKGKKTYLLVAVYLSCIALEKVVGIDVPGFEPGDNWVDQVWTMLGIGTVRAGIAMHAEDVKAEVK